MPNICVVCRRTSRKFKDLKFIPFPKKKIERDAWLNSLKLVEEDLTASSRICGFHFFGGQKNKTDVPSLSIGTKLGSKAQRHNPKDKIRKTQINQAKNVKKAEIQSHTPSTLSNLNAVSQENDNLTTISAANDEEPTVAVGPSGDNVRNLASVSKEELLQKISELETKNNFLVHQNLQLQSKLFSVNNFLHSDKDISFYTGFPNTDIFMAVFNLVGTPSQYYGYLKKCINGDYGRKRLLDPLEEFFMYWVYLRHALPVHMLSNLFSISIGTVHSILKTWCILINFVFNKLPIYPTREEFEHVCPNELKKLFPSCLAIYDCTEFYIQMPSKLDLQGVAWSEYYHHHTAKALIGITLWGSLCFCSKLYPGGISDPEIFRKSGAVDLINKGDQIMVDKGFLIDEDVVVRGGVVVRPAFKNPKQQQFNPQQVESSRKIASVRIYVEQAIKRIKSYRALDNLAINELKFGSMNFQNAAIATNFQNGFVSAANPDKNDNKLQMLYDKFCADVESIQTENIELETHNNDETLLSNDPFLGTETADDFDVTDTDEDLETTLGLLHLLQGDVNFDFSEIDPKVEFASVNEFEIM